MIRGVAGFGVIAVVLVVIACGKEKEITINHFKDFPDEINGCACYFSADKDDFIKGSYIYADNYGDTAFISINGVMTKFMLTKQTDVTEGYWIKVYNNDEYEVTVDSEEVWQVNQTWLQKGRMTVRSKKGATTTENIYGECGC